MSLLAHEIFWIPIERLEPAPWNYKHEGSPLQMSRFKASLRRNGLLGALTAAQRAEDPGSDQWEVVDGNHRLTALQDEGVESVPCYLIGRLVLAERQRVGIELNEHKFDRDPIKLGRILDDLSEIYSDSLLETTPFTTEQLDGLQALVDFETIDDPDPVLVRSERGERGDWATAPPTATRYAAEIKRLLPEALKEISEKLNMSTDLRFRIVWCMVEEQIEPENPALQSEISAADHDRTVH